MRAPRSGHPPLVGISPLQLHCADAALDRIDTILKLRERGLSIRDPEILEKCRMGVTVIAPWEAFTVGPYRVQTVAARHDEGHEAMLFAIEDARSGGRIFYGTDTGPLPAETWPRLAGLGWSFELFILDHTFGFGKRSSGHLNQEQFLEEVAAARAAGLIGEGTRVIATHLAHHSHPAHGELCRLACEHRYEIAWDGWTVATI